MHDPVYGEAYRRAHHLGAASSVQRAITQLTECELIEAVSGNGYRIADVFLRHWIAQRARP